MVAGASGTYGGVPFATAEGPAALDRFPADFHLPGKAKEMADKVGTQAIEAAVYKDRSDERHAVDAKRALTLMAGAQPPRAAGARARCDSLPHAGLPDCVLQRDAPQQPGRRPDPARPAAPAPPAGSPFAADWVPPPGGAPAYPSDFVLPARDRAREPTGKVGALQAFDPSVYAGQIAANQAVSEAVARKLGGGGAPFATSTGFDELRRRDYYHPKQKKADGVGGGKVRGGREGGWGRPLIGRSGTHGPTCPRPRLPAKPMPQPEFDAAAYTARLRENQEIQTESTHKKYVGSGNVLGWSS